MISANQIEQAIYTPIQEVVDPQWICEILLQSPFIHVSGAFNVRELILPSTGRKREHMFRSGSLERLTVEGSQALQKLGIKIIFDLRSLKERTADPVPEISGVEVQWTASSWDDVASTARIRHTNLMDLYFSFLESHSTSFGAVLRHVLEHPDEPFLFHCAAGRDRTGVLAAIIHSLAGTSLAEIERDYALTRIGIEPVRDYLLQKWSGDRPMDLNDPKIRAMIEAPLQPMTKLLSVIDERYGGLEGYAKSRLGFTDEDIAQIKRHLRN